MAEEDVDGVFHDLGILFVHGIGQTGRSETLLRFGEPLRQCIEALAISGSGTKPSALGVSISAATLDPEFGKEPARAEMRIGGAGAVESRWLLAEAWWSKKFPTATFGEIAGWCFKVVPWTLVAHFDRRLRRMGFRIVAVLDEDHTLRGLALALRWALEVLKLTMALALLPFLLAILLVLTLIGVIPFAPIRNFARSVQRILAATLGDSFVLLDQPIIAAAITDSVKADLEWLAKRCRRVAIVAHSQGAAIAHQVLRGPLTAPCDVFVTLGSGLAKLEEIRHIAEQGGHKWLWLATGGALLAALCLCGNSSYLWHGQSIWAMAGWLALTALITELGAALFDLARVNPFFVKTPTEDIPPAWRYGVVYVLLSGALSIAMDRPDGGWLQPAVAAVFAAGLAVGYLAVRRWQIASGRSLNKRSQWQRDRDLYSRQFQLRSRRNMCWLDFFASADAVPNAPLMDDFVPEDLLSFEVTNAHSIVTDHTSYWKNKDEFLPLVAKELLKASGLGSRYVSVDRVARRRRWRVASRVAGRWILGSAAAVLAGRLRSDEYPRDKAKNAFLRGMELDAQLAALPYVEFIVRKHDIDAGLYLCSQEKWLERFFAEPLFKLGQFLLQRHRGEAAKLFRQALEKRWASAAVELYKMLESSSVSDADATLALTSKHDRPFLEEVARLFRDNHRGRVADIPKQVIRLAPTPRPTHALHLGYTAQDDFFGSRRHSGWAWLATQAREWPAPYRAHFWAGFEAR